MVSRALGESKAENGNRGNSGVGGDKLQVQVMVKVGLPARWHLSEDGRGKGSEPSGYQSEGIKTEEPRSSKV